jgi:O-antigen ligase
MFWRQSGATGRRTMTAIWIAALLGVLVSTRSRGPMLALATAAGVLWLLKVRPTLRVTGVLLTGAAVSAAIVFASELRGLVEWLASRDTVLTNAFFRGQTADTVFELNGRLTLWQDLQPVLLDRLTFGYGYQASRAVLLETADWAAYAHNAFLQTALDLGVIGLLVVLWMFAPIARSVFSRSRDRAVRATVVALTVFLVLNAMSTESFAAVPHFETLLLFVCALCAAATVEHRDLTSDLNVTPP